MRGTIVVLLLLYAAVVAAAASRWLSRAFWPLREPRAAIAAWQAATLSVIASVGASGVILAVPCLRISTDPAVLRACLSLMWAQYATPEGTLATVAGSVLVVAVLGRITWCTGMAMVRGVLPAWPRPDSEDHRSAALPRGPAVGSGPGS